MFCRSAIPIWPTPLFYFFVTLIHHIIMLPRILLTLFIRKLSLNHHQLKANNISHSIICYAMHITFRNALKDMVESRRVEEKEALVDFGQLPSTAIFDWFPKENRVRLAKLDGFSFRGLQQLYKFLEVRVILFVVSLDEASRRFFLTKPIRLFCNVLFHEKWVWSKKIKKWCSFEKLSLALCEILFFPWIIIGMADQRLCLKMG